VPKGSAGKPTSGAHTKGEVYMDSAGTLFVCTANGTPALGRGSTRPLSESLTYTPPSKGRSYPVPAILFPYSPECVEDTFCELRHDGVLRSSADVLFNMGPSTF
jgi:hypothetical protein